MSLDEHAGDAAPRFDFHARNVYLTYPRCTISSRDALTALVSKLDGWWSFACVSHELHEDGGDHLHGLICFNVRVHFDGLPFHALEPAHAGPLIIQW